MSRSVEVSLSDFFDDDLIDEVCDRDLVDEVVAERNRRSNKGIDPSRDKIDTRTLCGDALGDIFRKRPHDARDAVLRAIESVAPYLGDALLALAEGRTADAICALNAHIEPSPAATATLADVRRHVPAPAREATS
jgi:hypothetical protein